MWYVIRILCSTLKKRPINVVGIKGLLLLGIKYLLSIIFSCCYYQAFTLKLELLGTDFLLENESITISIVLSNSHDNYRLNSHGNRDIFYPYYRNLCKVWNSLLHVELVSDLNSMHSHTRHCWHFVSTDRPHIIHAPRYQFLFLCCLDWFDGFKKPSTLASLGLRAWKIQWTPILRLRSLDHCFLLMDLSKISPVSFDCSFISSATSSSTNFSLNL